MPWKIFSWLGKNRDAALLIVIGALIVPYSLKKIVEALAPLISESRSVRADLHQEVLQAEARSKEYADVKHAEVIRAILRVDGNIDAIHRRLDRIYQQKTAGVIVKEKATKN